MIGVACAQTILAPAPYAYSSYVYDEPKPSYEYSTSVQTPTYNNYAHVRSGGLFERKIFAAPLATGPVLAAAAEPIIAEAKYVEPVSLFPFQLKFFHWYKPWRLHGINLDQQISKLNNLIISGDCTAIAQSCPIER